MSPAVDRMIDPAIDETGDPAAGDVTDQAVPIPPPAAVPTVRISTTPDPNRLADVAVVVVHGMGRQVRGQTLLEWAEPIVQRIDWLTSPEAGDPVSTGVSLVDVRIGGAGGGADGEQSRVVIDVDGPLDPEPRRVLITEARWADSFLAMTRREVFRWGAIFVWRALARMGTHFARTILIAPLGALASSIRSRRALAKVLLTLLFVPTAAITAATVGIVVAGLLAAGVIATVGLPLVGVLLLVPGVKSVLQGIVDTLVDFVGDVGVWRERPVRGAAMTQVVYAEIARAAASITPGGRVVVIAHSQGAAIASRVVFTVLPTVENGPRVDTLITLGAAVSLLGPSRLRRRGPDLLTPVADWIASPTPVRWVNFWAIWDPFSAGPIADTARDRFLRWRSAYAHEDEAVPVAAGPEERPVHTTAFPFGDHQSYPRNIAQVIDPIARELADLPPGQPGLRRRWVRSVKSRGVNRILATALAAVVPFTAVPAVLIGALGGMITTVTGWIPWAIDPESVRVFLERLATGGTATVLGALVVGLLVLGTLGWFGEWIWHRCSQRVVVSATAGAWGVVDAVYRLVLSVGGGVAIAGVVFGGHPLAVVSLGLAALAVWALPFNPAIPRDVPASRVRS